jgi:hypothetical protein
MLYTALIVPVFSYSYVTYLMLCSYVSYSYVYIFTLCSCVQEVLWWVTDVPLCEKVLFVSKDLKI